MTDNNTQGQVADNQLVSDALAGDERAFAALLKRYHNAVYCWFKNKTQNDSDAEDLTMETFAKAFNNLASFSPVYAFNTWLYAIATNHYIDFMRKKSIRPATSPKNVHDIIEFCLEPCSDLSEKGADDLLTQQQAKDIISDIVKTLPTRYAQLIDYRYFKELSYDEISRVMNIPIGTVSAQLNRAKKLLLPLLPNKDIL